jgi:hypothetical protein
MQHPRNDMREVRDAYASVFETASRDERFIDSVKQLNTQQALSGAPSSPQADRT